MCPVCVANGMPAAFAVKQLFFSTRPKSSNKPKQDKMRIETLETDNTSKVVSEAEWLVARKDLLTREKELTRLRDEVSRHRRELPWVRVKKEYLFDGPNGQETLTDLFDSRSQLIVYHFMFGPDWEEGCKSC